MATNALLRQSWTHGVLALAAMLCIAPAPALAETPYNRGVAAWQKKHYAKAAREWSTEVVTGNLNAVNNLAYLYSNGLGVKRQHDVALRLWQMAAYSGHSESQWHVGIAYEHGLGVDVDPVRAYAWYGCAVASATRRAQGEEADIEARIRDDAESSLATLKAKLNDEQLALAEALRAQLIGRYGEAAP